MLEAYFHMLGREHAGHQKVDGQRRHMMYEFLMRHMFKLVEREEERRRKTYRLSGGSLVAFTKN